MGEHILLHYGGPLLKSYTLRYTLDIYVSLKISTIVQFNKYFSNVYFPSTVVVARDAEIIITSCDNQALPRLFCFALFFTMSDPLLSALDTSSHFILSIAL